MIGAGKILEGFSGKLGERWLDNLFTPALLFWTGGLVAWASGPFFTVRRWPSIESAVVSLPGGRQVALAIGALLVVLVSSAIAERFTLPLLRLFGGWWPAWAQPLADRLASRYADRRAALDLEQQELESHVGKPSRADIMRLLAIKRQMNEIPIRPLDCMPTKMGNLSRVAERVPDERYGLDANVCWPRLWLVIGDSTRSELSDARGRLDVSARLMFWSLAFFIWTAFSIVAVPVTALLVAYAYRCMLDDMRTYGGLSIAVFDVERRTLYKAVGWRFPSDASLERKTGLDLSAYLKDGDDRPDIQFVPND